MHRNNNIKNKIYPSILKNTKLLYLPYIIYFTDLGFEDGVFMDIIALVIGFSIGVVVVAIAIEMGMKKTSRAPPASKHTDAWSLDEIANPRIMVEYMMEGEIPEGVPVLVNQYRDKNYLKGTNAKLHNDIKGNYILGDDRVLILSGPFKKDEVGVWTVEKEIVEKLNNDFNKMWNTGSTIKFEEK